MSWETWDTEQVCLWVTDVCEMDSTPWRKAGVTGAQMPTLSIEMLTNELGLSKLMAKKALREIDTLASSGQPPSPSPPPSPSRPSSHRATASSVVVAAANAGGSMGWLGYVVAILAILSHLVWHPTLTHTNSSSATTPSSPGAISSEETSSGYAILTMYTDDIAGYGEQATLVKQLYCLRHGYRLIVERAVPGEAELTAAGEAAGAQLARGGRLHPSWAKLHFISKHLGRGGRHKFLIWMDADVLVMNLGVPLNVITGQGGDLVSEAGGGGGGDGCSFWACQDQELVAAEDWKSRKHLGVPPEYLINAGVLVFRDDASARSIIDEAWSFVGGGGDGGNDGQGHDPDYIPKKYDLYHHRKPVSERGWPWDQGAFWEVLTKSSAARTATCVSRSSFNKLTTPPTDLKEGWVFHMTDWKDEDRARYAGAVLRHHLDPEANPIPRIQRG